MVEQGVEVSETPTITVEPNNLDPITSDLIVAGEIIDEIKNREAPVSTSRIFNYDVELPNGLLVFAFFDKSNDPDARYSSVYMIRQLSDSFKPGSRQKEEVVVYYWSASDPGDRDKQHVSELDSVTSKLIERQGFTDKDAKNIKKLMAKAKKTPSQGS